MTEFEEPMTNEQLISILCCPETHQSLQWADEALIADLNKKIAEGGLVNRQGDTVQEKLDGGLIREDRKYLYPVRQEIPVLLVDEAIPVEVSNEA